MNIYPSYKCNFSCSFCYIKNIPGELIDLDWLHEQFWNHPELCHDINILGGEPSILPLDYQRKLIDICTKVSGEKPLFITNLYNISPYLNDTQPIISYDFNLRQSQNRILSNIISLNMDFALSFIMTNNLVKIGSKKFITFINRFKNCKRVDLLMYRNGDTGVDHSPNHDDLMEFVADVIDHPKVNFTPYSSMKGYSDNYFDNISGRFGFHPGNKYGVRIDYNSLLYTSFDTYETAIDYYNARVSEIKLTDPCRACEFLGRCWCVGGYTKGECHGDLVMMKYFKSRNDENVCPSI